MPKLGEADFLNCKQQGSSGEFPELFWNEPTSGTYVSQHANWRSIPLYCTWNFAASAKRYCRNLA